MKDHREIFLNKKTLEEKYPFLKDFQYDHIMLSTKQKTEEFYEEKKAIKQLEEFSIIHDDYKDQSPVPISYFYQFQGMSPEQYLYNKYVIQPTTQEFLFEKKDFLGVCKKCKRIIELVSLEDDFGLQCCSRDMYPCWQLKLRCQDESIHSKDSLYI